MKTFHGVQHIVLSGAYLIKSGKSLRASVIVAKGISGQVLTLILANGALSAMQLRTRAAKTLGPVSLAGIYKSLRSLSAAGVIVKQGAKYEVALQWLLETSQLLEKATLRLAGPKSPGTCLPAQGKRAIFNFGDFHKLNNFAWHVVLALCRASRSEVLYNWNPHPWFYVSFPDEQRRFVALLRGYGKKLLKVVGGKEKIDRAALCNLDSETIRIIFLPRGKFLSRREYVLVAPPYVAKTRIDPGTAALIDALFALPNLPSDEVMNRLFKYSKVRASVEIRHSPGEASRLCAKFRSLAPRF